MPELPEVETVRIGLSELIVGKEVRAVEHDWPKSFPNAPADVRQFLVGAKILAVRRRAKVLLIDLDSNYSLVIHLKMTGQMVYIPTPHKARSSLAQPSSAANNFSSLDVSTDTSPSDKTVFARAESPQEQAILWRAGIGEHERFGAGHPNSSLVGKLPDVTTRVEITFQDGGKLFFNDQRKFGWMRLIPTPEIQNLDFFKKVGPEPLAADFTADNFIERLMRRAKSGMKAVLLDQTVIAGIGNIYADEGLWAAKIHPETKVRDVPRSQLVSLYKALRDVLQLSIEKGGSTDRNYVNTKGKKGSYLTFAKVFRRDGQPCPRCGTTIFKTRVAGRGTHTCTRCQQKLTNNTKYANVEMNL